MTILSDDDANSHFEGQGNLVRDLCVLANGDREACGFVISDPENQRLYLRPVTNVAENEHDFEMDEGELLKVMREDFSHVIAVYHTHPGGRETPTDADRDYMPHKWRYLIATPNMVTEWKRDRNDQALFIGRHSP